MANTIRAAKNTFGGGLVMDLAPDTTPNEVLTSALNATLVTFNGNEMLLQNDMGNGRVETARLPEGYIPVGTCEFGDIIYIVSYNPLTNKSLIGCFPSPERNIGSEEIGSTGQTLSWHDFQEGTSTPNGELKASSVKKIIYNNKLNPGDKFVIYDKNKVILSETKITDIGNTSHVYGTYPKWIRIHVIAIEDGGKINYLDSTLRWYNGQDYFIRESKTVGGEKVDLDSYRSLLSSGYSVFLSKVSGKLALLIELEKISGFSCTYSIFGQKGTKQDNIDYRNYTVYWNISWDSDNPNINPAYICLTKSEWTGKDSDKKGKWYYWSDPSINPTDEFGEVVKGVELKEGIDVDIPDNWEENITPTNITSDIDPINKFNNNNYNIYQNSYEYNVLLQGFLSSQTNTESLTKLNIARNGSHMPILGKYYINATYYDNKTRLAYTLESDNGKLRLIHEVSIDDVIVNNYFHYPVYKEFYTFEIPISLTYTKDGIEYELKPDTSNLIYHYEITPAMPYGYLREYSIDGYIDFSKIGTGAIDINAWKYFNGENVSTLTIGMDAYLEENMGIDEVVLEFYDNQGMAAAYHISDKESYAGQFTEMIPLNGSTNTYKMLNVNSEGKRIHHCGMKSEDENDVGVVYFNNANVPTLLEGSRQSGIQYYLDDCGTIYSNMLYLVKIVVKYCPKNALGQLDTSSTTDFKVFYRWFWTNTMFNKYYHLVTDYLIIPLELTLDVGVNYQPTDDYYYKLFQYQSKDNSTLLAASDIYKYLSAGVQVVTTSDQVEELDSNGNPINGGGDSGGGSGSGDDPGESYEEEEPLTSAEIIVYSSITSGYISDLQIMINRTLRSVDTNKLTVTIDGVVTTSYTVLGENGSGSIIITFYNSVPSTSNIQVSGTYGMFTYGNNQNSPTFTTTPLN